MTNESEDFCVIKTTTYGSRLDGSASFAPILRKTRKSPRTQHIVFENPQAMLRPTTGNAQHAHRARLVGECARGASPGATPPGRLAARLCPASKCEGRGGYRHGYRRLALGGNPTSMQTAQACRAGVSAGNGAIRLDKRPRSISFWVNAAPTLDRSVRGRKMPRDERV
jgi:hypothetical protein